MALIQIDTDNPRDVRALQLAATADQWVRLPGGAFEIRSAVVNARYRVTADSCTCYDNAHGNVCKHRRAVRYHEALQAAPAKVSAPAPAKRTYYCQCSASGSQGSCGFQTDDVFAMQDHSRDVHHWEIDRAVAESMRDRKPLTPEASAALWHHFERE